MTKKKIDWRTHPSVNVDPFEGVVRVDLSNIKKEIYFNANSHDSYELITSKNKTSFSTIQRYFKIRDDCIRCSKFLPINVEGLNESPTNLFYREVELVFPESNPTRHESLDKKLTDFGLSREGF